MLTDQKATIIRADNLNLVELGAAVCKNRKVREDSDIHFKLAEVGHWSVLEHVYITTLFTTSRNISHQLVRHRLANYSEQSTTKGKIELEFIKPWWWEDKPEWQHSFQLALTSSINNYNALIETGMSKIHARDVLPGCLATKILVTANLREWRHIYQVRSKPPAHPDFQLLMNLFISELWKYYPDHARIIEIGG